MKPQPLRFPLLFLSATPFEIAPLQEELARRVLRAQPFPLYQSQRYQGIYVLHTGIAKVNTAAALAFAMTQIQPQTVLQAGIGGSFSGLEHGTVVLADSETDMDGGIRFEGTWQDMRSLGFPLAQGVYNRIPLQSAWHDYVQATLELTSYPFATSDSVSGDTFTKAQRHAYGQAEIESMEGFAAAQVCHIAGIPFVELRSVSNQVGVRDKSQWNIPLAIAELNQQLIKLVAMLH